MRINPDVVFRVLGEAAVLVHLSSNEIYELNETGAAIWSLIEQGTTDDDIIAGLVTRFDVDDTTARHAHSTLVAELLARRLLLS